MASPSRNDDPTDNGVQRTRAWTGLWVVIAADIGVITAAVIGILVTHNSGSSPVLAILTSAFTAIGTTTTAYFGIRTMSNATQSLVGIPGKQ
jgi:hypothetical protein